MDPKNQEILIFFKDKELEKYNRNFENFYKSKFRQNIREIKIVLNRIYQNIGAIIKNYYIIPFIIRNYIGTFIYKKSRLRSLEIAVGYECNAKCEQCSCALARDITKKRLSLTEFKTVIDEAIKLGTFQFNITGGEPLLYEREVYEIIKYIRSKNGYIHLCTNASLITKNKFKNLIESGLNSIEMGLDSASKIIHNNNRRIKSFEKIMEVIGYAREFNIPVILNTIITHEKIKNYDMLALIKLVIEKNILLQITPPCVTGRWKNELKILLTKKEEKYLRWLLGFKNVRMDTYSSFFSIRCPAAREKIGISPYGDVMSCPLIQINYGNIRNENLDAIRNKMFKNPFYFKKSKFGCLPSFDKKFIKKYMTK